MSNPLDSFNIKVSADGNCVQFVWSDDWALMAQSKDNPIGGSITINRVSHVDAGRDGNWYADLSPVRGPVLGPFVLRADALAAEVAWLKQNLNL